MSTTMLCETRQGSQSRFRSCSLRSKPMMFLLRDPNVVREDRSTQRCVLRVVWLSSSPKLLTLSQRCSRSTGHSTEALKTTTPSRIYHRGYIPDPHTFRLRELKSPKSFEQSTHMRTSCVYGLFRLSSQAPHTHRRRGITGSRPATLWITQYENPVPLSLTPVEAIWPLL